MEDTATRLTFSMKKRKNHDSVHRSTRRYRPRRFVQPRTLRDDDDDGGGVNGLRFHRNGTKQEKKKRNRRFIDPNRRRLDHLRPVPCAAAAAVVVVEWASRRSKQQASPVNQYG